VPDLEKEGHQPRIELGKESGYPKKPRRTTPTRNVVQVVSVVVEKGGGGFRGGEGEGPPVSKREASGRRRSGSSFFGCWVCRSRTCMKKEGGGRLGEKGALFAENWVGGGEGGGLFFVGGLFSFVPETGKSFGPGRKRGAGREGK